MMKGKKAVFVWFTYLGLGCSYSERKTEQENWNRQVLLLLRLFGTLIASNNCLSAMSVSEQENHEGEDEEKTNSGVILWRSIQRVRWLWYGLWWRKIDMQREKKIWWSNNPNRKRREEKTRGKVDGEELDLLRHVHSFASVLFNAARWFLSMLITGCRSSSDCCYVSLGRMIDDNEDERGKTIEKKGADRDNVIEREREIPKGKRG